MKAKKFLSLLLALTMIMSVFSVATIPATAISQGEKLTYTLNTDAVFTTGMVNGELVEIAPDTNGFHAVGSPGAGKFIECYYTYEFTIPEGSEGRYNINTNFRWHETGRLWQVLFDDVAAGCTDTSIKYTDSAGFLTKPVTDDTGLAAATPAKVDLTAGTHTVTFKCVGAGSNGTNSSQRFAFAYFELVYLSEIPAVNDPVFEITGVPSVAKANFTLPVSVVDTANEDAPCAISWESSDTDAIAIEGGAATVTAAADSKMVTLTANVTTLLGNSPKTFKVLVPGTTKTDITDTTKFNLFDMFTAGLYINSNCTVATQGQSTSNVAGVETPGHDFVRTDNNGLMGASISFPINVQTAGAYTMYYVFRDHGSCGKVQTSINGVEVGDLVDQGVSANYNKNNASPTISVELEEGINWITFTVKELSGDNKLSSGAKMNLYDMYFTKVDESTANVIESVAEVADITVAQYVVADDIAIPETVTVTLGSGATPSLPVTWDGFDPTLAEEQTLTGTLDLSDTEYENTDSLTASVKINVVAIAGEEGALKYSMRMNKRTAANEQVFLAGDATSIGTPIGNDTGKYYWYGKNYGKVSVFVPAGTYAVSYDYKTRGAAGNDVQLAFNGENVGEVVNHKNNTQTQLDTGTLGLITVDNDGYYDFVFTSAEEFTCDTITLTPASYADYTAVEDAIAAASALVEADYSVYSWTMLQNSINSVVWDLTSDEQSRVDGFAAAINNAIAGLVSSAVELSITISEGMVTAADGGRYNITWNAEILAGENTSIANINELNVHFKEYGVYYASDEAVLADYENAAAEDIRNCIFANGEDIDVYTSFGFRLKNIPAERLRCAMFYVEYEYQGQNYIILSTVSSAIAIIVV